MLMGGLGDDILVGGEGKDTLTGGDGADIFAYRSTTDSVGAKDVLNKSGMAGGIATEA
jgi:Ca2+-binding RTX toxin-like protein